jgi:transcriptional regulator with XRE-family HTH domain
MESIVDRYLCDKIKEQRKKLGLTDLDVARKTKLSICEYGDIESYADEIFSVVPLYHVKKLCAVLEFDFLIFFKIACAFCEENKPYREEYYLSRSDVVRIRRNTMNLSTDELGDKVGFYGIAIENIETYTAHLESWVIDNILELSCQLEVPFQILLDIKCSKCGK